MWCMGNQTFVSAMNTKPLLSTTNIGRRYVISHAGRKASSGQPQQQGPPAWKRYAKKDKALGRQAEATLEMIWSKTEWLTDEHIQGMWDAHRVRKDVVIEWFANKRRESKRRRVVQDNDDDLM